MQTAQINIDKYLLIEQLSSIFINKLEAAMKITLILFCFMQYCSGSNFVTERGNHQAKILSPLQISEIATSINRTAFLPILEPILVPRVVGTVQHESVKQYLASQMLHLGWQVEEDEFVDETPFGPKNFTNIIAHHNPNASRFLVLACHYDSLMMEGVEFVGATDSAVPCAMMLYLAKFLAQPLSKTKNRPVSLVFIFFDGEEALKTWGPLDSLYGSRHLAHKLSQTPYEVGNEMMTELERMDILMVLDLIGARETSFHNFYRYKASNWYLHLSNIEKRLASKNLLVHSKNQNLPQYFQQFKNFLTIEDDHLPFIKKGVPVLHLISLPAPEVWHTPKDDISALDFSTISDLNTIFSIFVAEYLQLKF